MTKKQMLTADTLRSHTIQLEREWGVRPALFLACSGGSDEHWQIWHPDDLHPDGMPHLVVRPDGTSERHPDSTR